MTEAELTTNNAVCRKIPYKSTLNDLTLTVNGNAITYNGTTAQNINLDNNYQKKDADLTAIAALSGTGYPKRTADNT